MGLNLTPEIEARILANAREAGLTADEFLDHVMSSYEELAEAVARAEAKRPARSPEELRARLEESCAAAEQGRRIDGEEFHGATARRPREEGTSTRRMSRYESDTFETTFSRDQIFAFGQFIPT